MGWQMGGRASNLPKVPSEEYSVGGGGRPGGLAGWLGRLQICPRSPVQLLTKLPAWRPSLARPDACRPSQARRRPSFARTDAWRPGLARPSLASPGARRPSLASPRPRRPRVASPRARRPRLASYRNMPLHLCCRQCKHSWTSCPATSSVCMLRTPREDCKAFLGRLQIRFRSERHAVEQTLRYNHGVVRLPLVWYSADPADADRAHIRMRSRRGQATFHHVPVQTDVLIWECHRFDFTSSNQHHRWQEDLCYMGCRSSLQDCLARVFQV